MKGSGGYGLSVHDAFDEVEGVFKVAMFNWNTGSLAWTKYTGSSGGGGGDASASNQATGNNSLASIDTKTGSTNTKLDSLLTELQLKADLSETQPVSGPLTDTQLRAASVPVTANAGTNLNTSALALDTSVNNLLKPASTLAGVTSVTTLGTITNPVTVTPPALTKASQGATGFSVQNLKDAGRNQTNYWMAIQIVSTATDTLMSLTGYKGGVAVAATTTPAVVTTGKTYRITSVILDYTTIVTTPGSVRFTLRANLSGVAAIGSPAVCVWEVGEPSGAAPVAGKKNTVLLTFPDGIEFPAGTGIGISMVGLNTVGTAAAVGYGRITINGFEY